VKHVAMADPSRLRITHFLWPDCKQGPISKRRMFMPIFCYYL